MQVASNPPKTWVRDTKRWVSGPAETDDGGDVYLNHLKGETLCLQGADGQSKWREDVGGDLYHSPRPCVHNRLLVTTFDPKTRERQLVALDTDTGERVWTLGDLGYRTTTPLGDTKLLVSDQDGASCIDLGTGDTLWTQEREDLREFRAMPGKGDSLWARTSRKREYESRLERLEPATGAILSSVELEGGYARMYSNGDIGITIDYRDKGIHRCGLYEHRDGRDGSLKWNLEREGQHLYAKPSEHGVLVQINTEPRSGIERPSEVQLRDPETGETIWSRGYPESVTAEGGDSKIFVTGYRKREDSDTSSYVVEALDPDTGEKSWGMKPDIEAFDCIKIGHKHLFVHGLRADGKPEKDPSVVVAYDKETGEESWSYTLGSQFKDSVEDKDKELLYLSGGLGHLVCLDTRSGEALWHYDSDSLLFVSRELGQDGTLLCTTADGLVMKLGPDSKMVKLGAPKEIPERERVGYSLAHQTAGLGEFSVDISGKEQKALRRFSDFKENERSPILVADLDGDRKFQSNDLKKLPTREDLLGFDADRDGVVYPREMATEDLAWWYDDNKNSEVEEREIVPVPWFGEAAFDLKRMTVTERHISASASRYYPPVDNS